VQDGIPLLAPAAVFAVILPVASLNALFEGGFSYRRDRRWTANRFWLSFAVAAVVLVLQGLELIPMWNPA
jgi:hypothetical protein